MTDAAHVSDSHDTDLALQGCLIARLFGGFERIPVDTLNTLAWRGALGGRAADVRFAAEEAARRAPADIEILDTRGLCRALTGDIRAAIEDFRAFVAGSVAGEARTRRERWIVALEEGEDPFTEEEVKALRAGP